MLYRSGIVAPFEFSEHPAHSNPSGWHIRLAELHGKARAKVAAWLQVVANKAVKRGLNGVDRMLNAQVCDNHAPKTIQVYRKAYTVVLRWLALTKAQGALNTV